MADSGSDPDLPLWRERAVTRSLGAAHTRAEARVQDGRGTRHGSLAGRTAEK